MFVPAQCKATGVLNRANTAVLHAFSYTCQASEWKEGNQEYDSNQPAQITPPPLC